ncbi:hypothetical protein HZH68_007065 [Vespula germanica]|uniref:Uncharacterized protein n=1 Tax=Vespula germanica TaxID=30212 RepID=A0A834K7D6_VESGE|nr:hypothetical protein HZH68_007065 [Vespula germanica]
MTSIAVKTPRLRSGAKARRNGPRSLRASELLDVPEQRDVQWLICSCVLMATAVLSCLRSEFQCNNGHCIALNKVCNVVDDCGDGSDEERRRSSGGGGGGGGGEDKYDKFFVLSPATLLISFHLSGPDRSPS